MDGPLSGQADHAARSGAGGRGTRDWRRATSSTASSARRRTSSGRWSTRSTAWPTSCPRAAASSNDRRSTSQKKHAEVEERRRYTAAILERVATGVVTLDTLGRISTLNPAAARLLGLPPDTIGQPAAVVFARPDLEPLSALALGTAARVARHAGAGDRAGPRRTRGVISRSRPRRLTAETGRPEGRVLVLDDITPLIRAQKVAAWREVARRLAHEIKNPLTPIQLCAQRLQRQFAGSPDPVRSLVDECTHDHRRRGGVAEGAGRRILAVRADAVAAPRADGPARTAAGHAGALRRALQGRPDRDAVCRLGAAGAARSRPDPPRRHQPASTTRSRRSGSTARS